MAPPNHFPTQIRGGSGHVPYSLLFLRRQAVWSLMYQLMDETLQSIYAVLGVERVSSGDMVVGLEAGCGQKTTPVSSCNFFEKA